MDISKEIRNKVFVFSLLVIATQTCYAQSDKLSIQQITISDTILLKEANTMIEKYSESNTLFKSGLGGLTLKVKKVEDEEVLHHYFLGPDSFFRLVDDYDDKYYPLYYAYISNRLILIYIEDLEDIFKIQYDRKSKKKLQKNIEKFMEKKQKMVFKNSDGSVSVDKNFRGNPYFYLHAGIEIFIYKDKSVKVQKSGY